MLLKRNRLWSRLFVVALVSGSSAVVSHLARDIETTGYSNNEPVAISQLAPSQTVTSADNQIQLTIPSNWNDISQERNTGPSGLVVKSASNYVNVSFTSFAKADVPLSSELNAQAALSAGMSPYQDANVIEQDVTMTLNGYPAVMHRVEGTLLGQSMMTLSYAIETPDHYHMAIAITPAALFELNQPEIDAVLQSFDVVETAAFAP